MSDAGTYTLVFAVPEAIAVEVGALGVRELPAGAYAYTGSALGAGGFSRIDRHRRVAAGEHDVRHWHVDYLGAHDAVSLATVERLGGGRDEECRLARAVATGAPDGDPVPGFGASDCDCPSHLARFDAVAAAEEAVATAYDELREVEEADENRASDASNAR
ncbi:GIY-YIG nuclease family protein [Halobaculum magnesiiphilum]|uniref:GIY-YIG nuclease family protein n=1 Tax=Halobaculum magnesiiphilum TaxID=1017351 RepID=A0A8T8WEU6_9EURY|nr:GIY-YIG nuclease family protein [Halobaculum magnesiiphilum]QZP38351.1 GIY-YIG nuclease family protein [Halobaculum magnesiiphilum]